MRIRSILLLTLVLCSWFNLQAGEKITYRQVDSLTYLLYAEQKWDSLTIVGKLALKNNIDYYYLRMRMGIASYEQSKYFLATTHFKQALLFDHYSLPAKNYLYHSQLLAGKKTIANRYSRNFSAQQKNNLGIKFKTVDQLTFIGGYSFNNNFANNGDIELLDEGATYGEQLLMGNMTIVSLGINLNFSPTVSLTGNLNFENVKKRNRYQYLRERWEKEQEMVPPNGSYRNNFFLAEEETEKSFDSYVRQFEFYLNAKVQMDDGWSFNLFTNILYLNMTQYDVSQTSYIRQDTLSYNSMSNRYLMINLEEFDLTFTPGDTSFVNYVVGINLQKDFNFIKLNVTGSVSKLYGADQFQSGLSLTYFPFGSHIFYGHTGFYYFNQIRFDNDAENRFLFNQMLGVKLSKKIWVEAEYYSGDLKNANIMQGAIVYNLPDEINYTTGLNLHIFVKQHLSAHLMYDYYDKTGAFFNNGGDEGEFAEYNFDYQTHNIIGGLKWTF